MHAYQGRFPLSCSRHAWAGWVSLYLALAVRPPQLTHVSFITYIAGFARWMGSASKGWPQFKHRLPEVALAGEVDTQFLYLRLEFMYSYGVCSLLCLPDVL